MSEPENPQDEIIQDENPPAKGRGKKIIVLVLALLLLGGAAGGGYFYFLRPAPEAETENEEDSTEAGKDGEKKPKKKKSSSSEENSSSQSKSSESEFPDDENVKNIIELQPFIVNLSDTENPRYLRMSVSVGVGGEGKEEKPDQVFITKIRNAMIIVLSSKNSDDILSVEGKAKLRRELLKAAQSVGDEPEVEAIYITDFIVQM